MTSSATEHALEAKRVKKVNLANDMGPAFVTMLPNSNDSPPNQLMWRTTTQISVLLEGTLGIIVCLLSSLLFIFIYFVNCFR